MRGRVSSFEVVYYGHTVWLVFDTPTKRYGVNRASNLNSLHSADGLNADGLGKTDAEKGGESRREMRECGEE